MEELAIDPEGDTILPGAIYRVVADRPMKGQGGVFVKLPDGAMGFLRQVSGLAPGQPVLVQVSGAAEPGKAVPVTAAVLRQVEHRRAKEAERQAALQALDPAARPPSTL